MKKRQNISAILLWIQLKTSLKDGQKETTKPWKLNSKEI